MEITEKLEQNLGTEKHADSGISRVDGGTIDFLADSSELRLPLHMNVVVAYRVFDSGEICTDWMDDCRLISFSRLGRTARRVFDFISFLPLLHNLAACAPHAASPRPMVRSKKTLRAVSIGGVYRSRRYADKRYGTDP